MGPGPNCSLQQGRALRVSFTGELGWELHPATADVAPLLGQPSLVKAAIKLWIFLHRNATSTSFQELGAPFSESSFCYGNLACENSRAVRAATSYIEACAENFAPGAHLARGTMR